MTLTLSVLRCPDRVAPETRQVRGGDYVIGRGSDTDWPLTDPDRVLSKRHCVLEYRGGGWQVRDTSSNGTYLNRDAEPIGQGLARELRDGDRLRLGGYEIEMRVEAEASSLPVPDRAKPAAGGGFDDSLFGGPAPARPPFGDPFAEMSPASPRDDISIGLGGPSGGQLLPDDFDLGFEGNAAPTQTDHAPAGEQAFLAPRPMATLLPDDDEDDWLKPLPATPTAPLAAPMPPPAALPPPPPAPIVSAPIALPPVVTPPVATPPLSASPFDEPDDLPRVAPRAAPPVVVASAPAAAATGADMALFLKGAGIDAQPNDPAATMTALGAAFRALVSGIRQTLIARAAIKGEFRIEQTMVRARGNNPLKFSADDDDALLALLGAGRRTDMTPQAAVADALRDIRLHELATMAAMQQAVRAMLTRLDPAPLRAEADRAGGLLPAQKRARAWDAYEKLHGDISRALADDFDSVFGKAFARAYEQALADAADKERP